MASTDNTTGHSNVYVIGPSLLIGGNRSQPRDPPQPRTGIHEADVEVIRFRLVDWDVRRSLIIPGRRPPAGDRQGSYRHAP